MATFRGARPAAKGSVAERPLLAAPPPLALYVHIPWCVRKCPYCDFNSHALRAGIPETDYVDTLLWDLDQELLRLEPGRPPVSVFIGGGTPSLLSGAAVAQLLAGIRARIEIAPNAEITLETNPGTAGAGHLAGYREAGVNRLSIGVQSFSAPQLVRLGRIHDPQAALAAVAQARVAGFDNLNLDLMYGLPGQTLVEARQDLEQALHLETPHLSYYQLTLEPNTAFFANPPPLPEDDLSADMQEQGMELLAAAGLRRYEVSAYARPGWRCRHNLNYWTFGDYIGIGAGAHGKLTHRVGKLIERRAKVRHPAAYLDPARRDHLLSSHRELDTGDLALEFVMNALRLVAGFTPDLFERRTGLPFERISGTVEQATDDGLLGRENGRVHPTDLGLCFLNDLCARFAGS